MQNSKSDQSPSAQEVARFIDKMELYYGPEWRQYLTQCFYAVSQHVVATTDPTATPDEVYMGLSAMYMVADGLWPMWQEG